MGQGAVAQVENLDGLLGLTARGVLNRIFDQVDANLYMCEEATPLAWNFTNDLLQELHTNLILRVSGMALPRNWIAIQLNNSINDSKPSIIRTGVGDINRIGEFEQWNGNRRLDIWPGETANEINGTEGLIFHPFLERGEGLETFVDDAVRSFPLEYKRRVRPLGLEAFRYQTPPSEYESAFTNAANARWGSWNPDGLLYAGVTQYPVVPVFGSKPHFLDGADELFEKVEGLHPDRDLHETTVDVEPITGANVQVRKLLQINMQVNRTDDFE